MAIHIRKKNACLITGQMLRFSNGQSGIWIATVNCSSDLKPNHSFLKAQGKSKKGRLLTYGLHLTGLTRSGDELIQGTGNLFWHPVRVQGTGMTCCLGTGWLLADDPLVASRRISGSRRTS